ncbi:MAG: hypothetical protein K1W40_05505 [Schaedlerella sp.]|uniref:Uncharacterized protein n=1 Tax=Petralouisia muris TaxID=3032872 RepID=A0AC61RNP3_9FIRM|nr:MULTISPECIES: DUF5688 family protein [Clostridia]EOS23301.1 hypothetical protein C806_02806 [Lachnospiraceae bacterium 3-1]EOT26942.1 hypothetical protein C805_01045 [Eubacterium sp. 14-2]TGY88695.1 hypothetical protein E5329_25490 [Petralouisia muris]
MMDYEVFKEVVKENLLDYMPEKYQDSEMRVDSVEKINRKMDGLSLRLEGGGSISPTIYISDMYKEYLRTGDLQETMQNAAEAMDKAFQQTVLPPLDLQAAKDNIIFQLVNTIQNEDMLQKMPHREFQDLSIIYRWVVSMDEKGFSSTMINNNLAKELGMGEEQLFKAAAENTRRILPPTVKSMNEVMREMFIADGMPPSMADLMIGEMEPEQTMWVISNECKISGAASMLYEDKLHKLAEKVGSDLYVMPSSVHEVIAVSVNMGEPEQLAQMVAEINMDQVELGERLSNQVYHYDKDLRKITLATDTPNKRLDGVVAEQGHIYEAKQSR